MTVMWVGLGGFAGAIARYGLDRFVTGRLHGPFPWGTFAVNVSGSFALGVLVALFTERFADGHVVRLALTTGFLGAYTTFSTYTLQTLDLAETGMTWHAFAYGAGSVVAGLAAALAGTWVGRSL